MSLSNGIKAKITPDAWKFWPTAKKQMESNEPRNGFKVNVNPDLGQLRRQLALERKRQEANAINIRVNVDKKGIAQLGAVRREVDHIYKVSSSRRAIRINIAVVGAAAIPLAIQGIMSLTTAVTQLSRATLVLPGVFSSVGAALATFATGVHGVADALKASGDAMKNSRQSAREYEKATRDMERAQRDVVRALKDANREIEDQKDKLKSGQLSLEQSQINVRRANERLAQGGFKSMSDWQQAVLDVKQANFDLGQTLKESKRDIQDFYDEQVKGATGTDKFKDSVDRLETSLDAFTKAQLQAAGMSEKFIEAMDRLSPKAQVFVRQVVGLRGAWQDLKNTVQDNLFDGLGDSVVKLAENQLPRLKQRMAEVATSLNGNFKQIFTSLGEAKNTNRIADIFTRTGIALAKMNPGINSFLSAFIHLSEVGSRFLPRLSEAFNKLGKRFDDFINRADADGSLERWIDRGLKTVNSLFNAIKSLGSIFGSVTKAYESVTGNVGGFAKTLETSLGKLAAFWSSPAGQKSLKEYIRYTHDFLKDFKEVLPGIMDLIKQIGDGLRAWGSVFFPIVAAVGKWASGHGAIVKWLVAGYAALRTIKPFYEFFSKTGGKIAKGWEASTLAMQAARAEVDALKSEQNNLHLQQRKYNNELLQNIDARKSALADYHKVQGAGQKNAADADADRIKAQDKLNQARNELNTVYGGGHTAAAEDAREHQDRIIAADKAIGRSKDDLADKNDKYKKSVVDARLAEEQATLRAASAQTNLSQTQAASKQRIKDATTKEKEFAQKLKTAKDNLDKAAAAPGKSKARQDKIDTASKRVKALEGELENRTRIKNNAIDNAARAKQSATLEKTKANIALERTRIDNANGLADAQKNQVEAEGKLSKAQQARNAIAYDTKNVDIWKSKVVDAQKDVASARADLAAKVKAYDKVVGTSAGAEQRALKKVQTAQDNVKLSMSKLNIVADEFKTINGRLADSMAAVDKRGFSRLSQAIGSANGTGMLGKLGAMASVVGTLASSIGGAVAGVGLIWALDRLATAQQKAGERTKYHLDRLNELKNALDPATGAVTAEGTALALESAQAKKVIGRENKPITVNAVTEAEKLGISSQQLGSSFDPTQMEATNQVLDKAYASTLAAVNSGKDKQWENIKEDANAHGFTAEDYAKALAGDTASVNKFNEYVDGWWSRDRYSNIGGMLPKSVAPRNYIPDLGQGVEALMPFAPGIAVGQTVNENLKGNRDGGNETKQIQKPGALSAAGNARFPGASDVSTTPSGDLAFNVPRLTPEQAQAFQNGDELIPNSSAQLNKLADNGDGTSRYSVVIPQGSPYIAPIQRAAGGSVWGSGSGTSDSIPAMLSNGEFVINAKSASVIGHDRLAAMNSIQKFDKGGPVLPGGHGAFGIKIPGKAKETISVGGGSAGPVQSITDPGLTAPGASLRGLDGKIIPGSGGGKPLNTSGTLPASGGAKSVPAPSYSAPYATPNQTAERRGRVISVPSLGGAYRNDPRGVDIALSRVFPTKGGNGTPGLAPVTPTGGTLPNGAKADAPYVLQPPSNGKFPTSLSELATTADALPYVYGAGHPGYRNSDPNNGPIITQKEAEQPFVYGFDCSSLVSYAANLASGLPLNYSVFATGTQGDELAKRGFMRGTPPDGSLVVGWDGKHTSMRLPDGRILEAQSSQSGIRVGKPGDDTGLTSPEGFGDVMYLPPSLLKDNLTELPLTPAPGAPPGAPAPSGGGGGAVPPGGSGSSDPQAFGDLSKIGVPVAPGGPVIPSPAGTPNPAPPGAPGGIQVPGAPNGSPAGPAGGLPELPGINAPIPGPFGPIPLQPFDFLKSIGMAILSAIFGFFGIDISGITGMINGVIGGIGQMGQNGQLPEGVPDPNVDPGADPEMVRQLTELADKAHASGDFVMEGQWRDMLNDYKTRTPIDAPGAPPAPVQKAAGGHIRGPGSGTSDSIPAMLSDGEYVLKASAVRNIGVPRLNALNNVKKFSGGGPASILPITPPPPPPPSVVDMPPPPSSGSSDPQAFQDLSDIPSPDIEGARKIGAELGSAVFSPKGGASGVSAGAKQPQAKDPRSILAQAPTSSEHNNPAFSGAIEGAFSTIGSLAGTAASLAIAGGTMGAGAPASGAVGSIIAGGAQMGGKIASGWLNILSSLGVGTVTPAETGQGYGAPLTAPAPSSPMTNFQSIHNGNITTNNLDEYSRLKDRKDAQKSAPFFNRVGQ